MKPYCGISSCFTKHIGLENKPRGGGGWTEALNIAQGKDREAGGGVEAGGRVKAGGGVEEDGAQEGERESRKGIAQSKSQLSEDFFQMKKIRNLWNMGLQ